MKVLYTLSLLSMMTVGFTSIGCEESHTESTKTNPITGTQTHKEDTTVKNPITGDTSTSHTEQRN